MSCLRIKNALFVYTAEVSLTNILMSTLCHSERQTVTYGAPTVAIKIIEK